MHIKMEKPLAIVYNHDIDQNALVFSGVGSISTFRNAYVCELHCESFVHTAVVNSLYN